MKINNELICFFDDYLVDTEKTTASFRLHEPVRRETVLKLDSPADGDSTNYGNMFFDDEYHGFTGKFKNGTYRLYYLGYNQPDCNPESINLGIRLCYAESGDGIHFEKPELGISEFLGNKNNNIIIGKEFSHIRLDNFMVFRDDNPECEKDKKYKGILSYNENANLSYKRLYCFYSPDGLHFREGDMITDIGYFDTLNIIFWDNEYKIYRGYIRDFHAADGSELERGVRHWDDVRDIRYIESKDFKTWSYPEKLSFCDQCDFQLYTNNVTPYFRNPKIYLGFPTIYTERQEWTPAYDVLCGAEKRKIKMGHLKREGLAVTDNMFMVSHDGKHFKRYLEAFMRPEEEQGNNWIYGDCYMTRGVFETKSDIKGAPNEMSLYLHTYRAGQVEFSRYTMRLDGFCSLHADYEEKEITTKPFVFAGDSLFANMATSAKGHIYFTLICEGKEYKSCEYFGNSIDKKIVFAGTELSEFAGKEVILKMRMSDADLYSIRFADQKGENV